MLEISNLARETEKAPCIGKMVVTLRAPGKMTKDLKVE